MTKAEKVEIVNQLAESFKTSSAVVIAEYKGLKCKELEALRLAASAQEVKVKVAKNTLTNIALKNAGIEGIELKDTNIIVWGEDQLSVAKVAAKYADDSKIFEIKTAYLDGEVADAAKVEALSKLPGREELLGMLASVWMAPIRNFTIGLDALRAKKEEESA